MIARTLIATCFLLLGYSKKAVRQDVIVYRPFFVKPMLVGTHIVLAAMSSSRKLSAFDQLSTIAHISITEGVT